MAHENKTLLPRHYEILDLLVAGYTKIDTAKIVGVSKETVIAVSRSPLFIAEFNRRVGERRSEALELDREALAGRARSVLEQKAERAAEVQTELLDSDDDSVKLRASGSILDRVLGKAEGRDVASSGGVTVQISAADTELLVLAMKETSSAKAEPSTYCPTAGPPENGQVDVHQAAAGSPRLGHREAEAQRGSEAVEAGEPSPAPQALPPTVSPDSSLSQ